MKKKQGFTLVELIAVMVILGIVLSILVPNIGNLMNKQEELAIETQVESLRIAGREYFTADRNRLPKEYMGQTAQVTLKTLIEKGHIEKIEYQNEACDVNGSYVTALNNGVGKYDYMAILVCGDIKQKSKGSWSPWIDKEKYVSPGGNIEEEERQYYTYDVEKVSNTKTFIRTKELSYFDPQLNKNFGEKDWTISEEEKNFLKSNGITNYNSTPENFEGKGELTNMILTDEYSEYSYLSKMYKWYRHAYYPGNVDKEEGTFHYTGQKDYNIKDPSVSSKAYRYYRHAYYPNNADKAHGTYHYTAPSGYTIKDADSNTLAYKWYRHAYYPNDTDEANSPYMLTSKGNYTIKGASTYAYNWFKRDYCLGQYTYAPFGCPEKDYSTRTAGPLRTSSVYPSDAFNIRSTTYYREMEEDTEITNPGTTIPGTCTPGTTTEPNYTCNRGSFYLSDIGTLSVNSCNYSGGTLTINGTVNWSVNLTPSLHNNIMAQSVLSGYMDLCVATANNGGCLSSSKKVSSSGRYGTSTFSISASVSNSSGKYGIGKYSRIYYQPVSGENCYNDQKESNKCWVAIAFPNTENIFEITPGTTTSETCTPDTTTPGTTTTIPGECSSYETTNPTRPTCGSRTEYTYNEAQYSWYNKVFSTNPQYSLTAPSGYPERGTSTQTWYKWYRWGYYPNNTTKENATFHLSGQGNFGIKDPSETQTWYKWYKHGYYPGNTTKEKGEFLLSQPSGFEIKDESTYQDWYRWYKHGYYPDNTTKEKGAYTPMAVGKFTIKDTNSFKYSSWSPWNKTKIEDKYLEGEKIRTTRERLVKKYQYQMGMWIKDRIKSEKDIVKATTIEELTKLINKKENKNYTVAEIKEMMKTGKGSIRVYQKTQIRYREVEE